MFPTLSQCLKRLFTIPSRPAPDRKCNRARPRYRPTLEILEDRLTPSTVNWTGHGDGMMWDNSANWDSGTVPGAADDVVIAVPGIAIFHSGNDVSLHSLQDTANLMFMSSLTLAANSAISGSFNLSSMSGGNLNLQTGATLTLSGGGMVMGGIQLAANSELNINGGTFNVSGGMGQSNVTLAIGSELLVSAGTFGIANGNVTNQGGTVELDAGSFMFMGGIFTNPGGTVNVKGGTFNIGAGTFTNSGGTVDVEGGVFSITGQSTFTQADPADQLLIGITGEIDVSGTTNLSAGSVTVSGLMHQTGGTVNFGTPVQVDNNAEVLLTMGTANELDGFLEQGQGTFTVGGGESAIIIGNQTNNNVILQTGGNITGNGTLTITGTMTWNGGANFLGNGNVRIASGAIVNLNGAGARTLGSWNLTVLAGGFVNFNGGSLTMNPQGTIDVRGGTITFQAGSLNPPFGSQLFLTVINQNNDGNGSLRWAINQFLAYPVGNWTIRFRNPNNDTPMTGTITLTQELPVLQKPSLLLSISQPSQSLLTITRSSAANTPEFRIFEIAAGTNVSISGLAITNGSETAQGVEGGAIANRGTLTLTAMDIHDNFAEDGGGGILNNGTMTINGCQIHDNKAGFGDGGAGILNGGDGWLRIQADAATGVNSSIWHNTVTSFTTGGGGLTNQGTALLFSTDMIGNTAGGSGGGIRNSGSLTVNGGLIEYNTCTSAGVNGGALFNESGTADFSNGVQIWINGANNNGGGIYVSDGRVTLDSCTVSGNTAGNLGTCGCRRPNATLTFTNCTTSGSVDIDNSP